MLTKADRVRLRDEMREKLASYHFDWFITLVLDEPGAGHERMRTLLRRWDAGVSRELNGPRWQKRPDKRLLWFAFPEKLEGHSHWHLVALACCRFLTGEFVTSVCKSPGNVSRCPLVLQNWLKPLIILA